MPQWLVLAIAEEPAHITEVVGHVNDETLILAAIGGASEAATSHLDVGVGTERWPRDIQRPNPRRVKALDQKVTVRQNLKLGSLEPLDDIATFLPPRLTTD